MIPGDRSELIPGDQIVPFDQLPQAIDPPSGWVQNSNDSPWTSTYPMMIDTAKYAPYIAPPPSHTQRSQRGIRLLSESGKITLADLKEMKLSTRSEIADHFVDDLVAAARQHGSAKAKEAAEILAKWDRHGNNTSDGTFLFLRFIQGAGNGFTNIGGYGVPPDPRQPLTTPRGFADPAKAVALLDREARRLEDEYDTMHVIWGDVIRLRRGLLDLPGNGLPGTLGAIRTIGTGPVRERQGRDRQRRHLLRRARVPEERPADRRGVARLRQLVARRLEARRRPARVGVAEEDAADHAEPRGDREESGEPDGVLGEVAEGQFAAGESITIRISDMPAATMLAERMSNSTGGF